MVMMRVSKDEIRRKIRRMLGRCHIGLNMSQQVNELIDNVSNLVCISAKEFSTVFHRFLSFRMEMILISDLLSVVYNKNKVLLFIGEQITWVICFLWRLDQ